MRTPIRNVLSNDGIGRTLYLHSSHTVGYQVEYYRVSPDHKIEVLETKVFGTDKEAALKAMGS
jgi:hypothetical protein